jgi:hypothetical protein
MYSTYLGGFPDIHTGPHDVVNRPEIQAFGGPYLVGLHTTTQGVRTLHCQYTSRCTQPNGVCEPHNRATR